MIDLLAPGPNADAVLTLAIVLGMFVAFTRETYPTEVVAIAGVALMLATGILPQDAGLAVLSNPAPWTIAAMFLVMGALVRTGSLDALTTLADRRVRTTRARPWCWSSPSCCWPALS